MSVRCRDGHDSEEPDYCSVCGAAIPRAGAPAIAAAHPVARGAVVGCPECGEPRAAQDARFCEVCRYDFLARARSASTPATNAAATPSIVAASPAPPAAAPAATRWELVVDIDAALDVEPDPATPCPRDVSAATFAVDRAELMVGRRDDRRDIRPDLPLSDPGASRRHLKFARNADGSVALHDLASTNGSKLNGVDVEAGSRHSLHEGDAITLGRWTRITLRRAK